MASNVINMGTRVPDGFRNIDSTMPDGAYVSFSRTISPDPDASPTDYECYDEDQLAAFSNGDWCFVGVQARATITVITKGHGRIYRLTSPGLWGVESFSEEAYFNEVFAEECETLKADLARFGNLQVVT